MEERIPPHSDAAERSVLGAIMLDDTVLMDALEILREEDFYSEIHKEIFAAVKEIHRHGEKVDIINWDDNAASLIENALSPAKVIAVVADEEKREAQVIVPDYQLSLAIGKEGQNARLAARLTGFKIDIKSETQARELGLFDELGIDYQPEGISDMEIALESGQAKEDANELASEMGDEFEK